MSKSVYAGSLLIALTLMLGSLFAPQSFLMSFVSSSEIINIIRAILALLMLGLMFTNPPRSVVFRAVLGAMSGGFVVWAIAYLFNGTIRLADSVLFLHAAVSFALASLEPSSILSDDEAPDSTLTSGLRRLNKWYRTLEAKNHPWVV
jgi:hypothetical protein